MTGRANARKTSWTKCQVIGKDGTPCGTYAHELWGACFGHTLKDPALVAGLIERLQFHLAALLEPDNDERNDDPSE